MSDLLGKTIGQYQLVEFIRRGDMSVVCRAFQPSMNRYVVVKILHPSLAKDQTIAEEFQQKAQLVAQLEHAVILPIYDFGKEDALLYVVTPYVEGGTLRDRLPRLYSLQDALQILRPIAEALDYAHSQGVVHGNLKPSNILINQHGQPLLTDFGLARRTGDDPSKVYLSPEQAQGQSIDKRTDVYALGVMLYEMLAGELPQTTAPPRLRLRRPDLPIEVEDVILKAMAQYPEQRYQTASALCDALEAVSRPQKAPAPIAEPQSEAKAEGLSKNVKVGIAISAALVIIGCGLVAIFGGGLFGGGPSGEATLPPVEITDIRGEYYDNPDLQGEPVLIRNDTDINFDWGAGSPAPEVSADNFSVRWTADQVLPAGSYRCYLRVDDGARLWIDDNLIIDEWQAGSARDSTADVNLTRGTHAFKLEYVDLVGEAVIQLRVVPIEDFPDWKAEYFDNRNLNGLPVVVRNETDVAHNWGANPPAPDVPSNDFSARWSRTLDFEEGTYTIRVHVEGGVRLWLDGALLIDDWKTRGPRTLEADSGHLGAGSHSLEVNYFKKSGNGQIAVRWDRQGVDQPPIAVISGPTEAQVGRSVRFDASGSVATEGSSIVAWQWDLGDGTQSTDTVVNHTYTVAGVYNATLLVTDDKGLSDSSTLQIRIEEVPPTSEPEQPPVAIITAPGEGQVGQAVTFDASQSQATNPIVSYAWDFGDGSTANAVSIDHVYNRAGTYNVRLTLTDDGGLQNTTFLRVYIADVVPPTEPPTVPPIVPPVQLQGKIVFESNRNGSPDIFMMDAADFSVSQLTFDPAVDTQPVWSPDGSRVAFVTNRDGNYEIYVVNSDGTDMINLTNDPADDLYPTWSPEGEWVAFSTNRDGNQEIYIIQADGSGAQNLTNDPAQDYKPTWFVARHGLLSVDERIAFVSDRDGNEEIYLMKTNGSELDNLTNHPANDFYPAVSPDGKQIVFTSDRDGNQEIYVMGIDGTGPVGLTDDPAEDLYPTWSPDGEWIAFTTNRDGNQEIYCMHADGSNQFNLTNNPATDLFPTWIEQEGETGFFPQNLVSNSG